MKDQHSRPTRISGAATGQFAVCVSLLLALAWPGPGEAGPLPTPSPLVLKDRSDRQPGRDGGTLKLQPRHSWMRADGLYTDFVVTFDYRLTQPRTKAVVTVRAQGNFAYRPRGYEITLPDPRSPRAGGMPPATITRQPGATPMDPDGWAHCELRADLGQIDVVIDGVSFGSYPVTRFVGYLFFETLQGAAEFRAMTIAPIDHPFDPADALSSHDLRARGGRLPKVTRDVRPFYPRDAMRERAQGQVLLEAVVKTDGSVGAVRVTRTLTPELDIAAIGALRAWTFEPALLDGNPTAAVVEVEMSFTLK